MAIKMLFNRVAIRLIVEEKTESGLYVVTKQVDTKKRGTVVAVGPGAYTPKGDFIETVVKVGDVVAYSGNGEKIEVDGEMLYVFPETSIIGVIS